MASNGLICAKKVSWGKPHYLPQRLKSTFLQYFSPGIFFPSILRIKSSPGSGFGILTELENHLFFVIASSKYKSNIFLMRLYTSMQKAEKAAARQGVIALLYYTRYFWDEDWLAGTRVETKRGIRVSREKRYLVTLWLALCLQPLLQLYCFIRTFFTMHNMFSGFTN